MLRQIRVWGNSPNTSLESRTLQRYEPATDEAKTGRFWQLADQFGPRARWFSSGHHQLALARALLVKATVIRHNAPWCIETQRGLLSAVLTAPSTLRKLITKPFYKIAWFYKLWTSYICTERVIVEKAPFGWTLSLMLVAKFNLLWWRIFQIIECTWRRWSGSDTSTL